MDVIASLSRRRCRVVGRRASPGHAGHGVGHGRRFFVGKGQFTADVRAVVVTVRGGILDHFVVVLLVVYLIGMYNGLVKLRNRVENAWAQIDVQLKRRST